MIDLVSPGEMVGSGLVIGEQRVTNTRVRAGDEVIQAPCGMKCWP